MASNTGYTLQGVWAQPRLGLQADAASGGGPTGPLKSFDPLFPKNAYFTEASINWPSNFIDVFPSVTIQPTYNFAVTAGVDVLWRYSTLDAFYMPPGIPVVLGSANNKRFLGAQSNLHAEWQATPHLNINAVYVHFHGRLPQGGRWEEHRVRRCVGGLHVLAIAFGRQYERCCRLRLMARLRHTERPQFKQSCQICPIYGGVNQVLRHCIP